MPISPTIRDMIIRNAASTEIKRQAEAEGMLTLRQNGIIKFKSGISTLEEVLKETSLA